MTNIGCGFFRILLNYVIKIVERKYSVKIFHCWKIRKTESDGEVDFMFSTGQLLARVPF